MNQRTNSKNSPAIRIMAVISFVLVIILIAWASIKLVNILPGAFSSLASVADSIKQESHIDNENEIIPLVVTSNATLISSGENIVISWNTSRRSGTYSFSYTCSEGASLSLIEETGEKSMDCNTNYNVGNVGSITIKGESEKNRYQDIDYNIDFIATSDDAPMATGSANFTIVNGEIKDAIFTDNDSDSDPIEVVEDTEEPEEDTEQTPTYQQEYTYEIPVSNPNGFTDLSTKYINSGNIIANIFFPGDITKSESGAIQFEVKNYGTKTSGDWIFEVALPNGSTYKSPKQKPLKPNERAILTIGFIASDESSHDFKIEIDENNDKNATNDRFTQKVYFK